MVARLTLRAMWRCDWTDTIMHCLMVAATFGILIGLNHIFGTIAALAVASAWATLLREATQQQSKKYRDDFRKGWDFWNWSPAKQLETFVPVLLALAVGFTL